MNLELLIDILRVLEINVNHLVFLNSDVFNLMVMFMKENVYSVLKVLYFNLASVLEDVVQIKYF